LSSQFLFQTSSFILLIFFVFLIWKTFKTLKIDILQKELYKTKKIMYDRVHKRKKMMPML